MIHRWIRFIQTTLLFLAILFGYNLFHDNEFEKWKETFQHYAVQQGVDNKVIDTALRGVYVDEKVLRLDAYQPEFSRSVWQYLDKAVSQHRIKRGRQLLAQHQQLLNQISQTYQVPQEYLLAIWAVETDYGHDTGRYSAIRSLATLAYRGREERRDFWRSQLVAALKIIQMGDIAQAELRGSWAGALGHTQFMPATFLEYAVDFDGDGKRDLIHSFADALASSANYLKQSGWVSEKPWGKEVILPHDFTWQLADPAIWQRASTWSQEEGVLSLDREELTSDAEAFLLLLAGYEGPAFLAFSNFQVFLAYNNAYSYALAVGLLGDQIMRRPLLQGQWPRHEKELSRAEKAEMQEMLTAAGYSTDGIDGLVGPNTRAALRRWQDDNQHPADGFATFDVLNQLRKQVELSEHGSPPEYK